MPSVATWWCGQDGPRRYVLEHLDQLTITSAFSQGEPHAKFPGAMGAQEREDLARRIAAEPDQFVAQERVALSTAPVLTEDGIVPRHIVLRVFAAWDGETYQVLPGGLTGVSAADLSRIRNVKLDRFSLDRMITILGKLDHEVEVSVSVRPRAA